MKRNKGNINGFVLIFVGVILLLNTLGIISWNVWNILFQFWPVLLILAGIELLLEDTLVGEIVMNVVVAATLLVIGLYALSLDNTGINKWVRKYLPFLPKINIYQKPIIPSQWYRSDL